MSPSLTFAVDGMLGARLSQELDVSIRRQLAGVTVDTHSVGTLYEVPAGRPVRTFQMRLTKVTETPFVVGPWTVIAIDDAG